MTGSERDMNDEPERLDIEDEFGAYLLGALSPEEEQRVEALLAESESARQRLRWMRPAAELLGETVEQHDPPSQLRARILDDIGRDMPSHKAARAERKPWFRIGGFALQPAVGLALVALVIVVAIGVTGYEIGDGGSGSKTYTSANASLSVDGDHGNLKLTHIVSAPANHDYQAWVQQDGTMIPSSLFGPWKNGTATAAIPHDLDGAQAVIVTVEPKGGSRAPTGARIASVKLSS